MLHPHVSPSSVKGKHLLHVNVNSNNLATRWRASAPAPAEDDTPKKFRYAFCLYCVTARAHYVLLAL